MASNVLQLRSDILYNNGSPRIGGGAVPVADVAVTSHLRALEQGGRHSPETVYSRSGALARLAAALPGGLLDATAADLAAWRASLTVAPGTITDYVSHAREFYDWAQSAGLIEKNPTTGLVLPRRRRRLPRPIAE
jgi:integrase/recombinase XerC